MRSVSFILLVALTLAPTHAHAFSCPAWMMRLLAGVVGKRDPLSARLAEAQDPYKTAFGVGEAALREFQRLVESDEKPRARAARLAAWASTPEKALYLYQNLSDLKNHAAETLSYLVRESPQFANAMRSKDSDSLITFAFEKEDGEILSRFYRPPDYDEVAWMKLDDKTRAGLVAKRLLYPKHKASATRLVPTREKPAALGGLQREVFGPQSFEVAHQSYEFDPTRMFAQLGEVTTKVGASDKIHVHVVFELPENYPLEKFSAWVKDMNDGLQLHGMQHGFFPAEFKQIPEVAPDPAPWFRRPFSVEKDLPTKLSEITVRRFKRFALGVRKNMYGPASRPGYVKIGLELRDVARDLPTIEAHTRRIAAMVRDRVWEKRPAKWDAAELPLTNAVHPDLLPGLKARGVRDDFAAKLLKLVPFLSIPLYAHEKAAVFDYGTGRFRRPDAAAEKRIAHAREVFWSNLKGLQARADYFAGEKKPWSDDALQEETRTILGYWAAYANLYQLRE